MKKSFLSLIIFSVLFLPNTYALKTVSPAKIVKGRIEFAEPKRTAGQADVLGLRCAPIDTVRVAIIGIGFRGSDAVTRYCQLEGVKIKALCDIVPEKVAKGKETLRKYNKPDADIYTGVEDWKKICERPDIDLIYVCTNWQLHTHID